jgi:predicted metalloprotease with PDZ domain
MSSLLRSSRPSLPVRLAAVAALCACGAAAAGLAWADSADAHISPPRDTVYPGTIQIAVDASDTRQGIFRVHEVIPVRSGELTLLYPKWIPGNHSPTGPIDMLAGLTIEANGKPLVWTRDEYDVYAFRVDVPRDASSLDVDFQYLSGRTAMQRIQMTDEMLSLEWSDVSVYPAGYYSRDITFAPSVTLPHGWQFGTALETLSQSGDTTRFKPVTYNTLIDSPMYAGHYFERVDLDPGAAVPVHLDVFADAPKFLQMTPEQLQAHRNLVTQAYKLFGSHHYDHYDFLYSLSEQLSGNGLEHHRSSEDGTRANYFTDWDQTAPGRDLLAHEYTHSWNGKFRRPADLWTPNFNVPMGDSLLWVYEGQTQYWGYVLTARAGMWNAEQFREGLALVAANYDRNRPGFEWRTIEDTTNDPTAAHREPLPYRSWQMSEEYYSAGQLVWLAVDSKIRSLTGDRKSLDTFARRFFGVDNGSFVTKTYTFDDLVAALNGVVKYDWAGFLHQRLDAHESPMGGIAASGWKLVYNDQESDFQKEYDSGASNRHMISFTFSIGLTLTNTGEINDVRWNGPAFKAGISTGATVVAVNGQNYSAEVMTDAIKNAEHNQEPIRLLLKYQGEYTTIAVDYHDGLQYPHLVRIEGSPDYLDEIIAARK